MKTEGLFRKCYELSKYKDTIRYSHLPFKSGYYVTEQDVVLMVITPTIYRLTDSGWVIAQSYLGLWYDSLDDFADIPLSISREMELNKYQIVKDSPPSSPEYINITEYFDRFRDECNALLIELQEHLSSIDSEKVQVLSPAYIDGYLDKVIVDVEENSGELLVAIKDGEITGLIAGIIEPKDEIDKITTRTPVRGIVTELVVKEGYMCNGMGKKLMNEMENYFRHRNCEFSAVNVFAPNQRAISFYEKSGYSNRNIEMFKRLG